MALRKDIKVCIVQTSLNADCAWQDSGSSIWEDCVKISEIEERAAKREIRHFLASIRSSEVVPDFVLFPELSIPLGFESRFRKASESLGAIFIGGLDYKINRSTAQPSVSNEAVVIVPHSLGGVRRSRSTGVRYVGKTYPAPGELKKLSEIQSGPVKFLNQPTVWLFESPELGKFGVAVCYDFLDLDRLAMYRAKIQTLFILAYNRDTTSFEHAAEALSRMLFCNVVVCNCGHFGGSLAVSPFRAPHRRTVYKHSGLKLPNFQIVELPVSELAAHQSGSNKPEFKSRPPGFDSIISLNSNTERV
ncbi:hypothetical protein KUV28_03730 [Ferrimonas balearica]|nr:hypothetical protein [Ferrimonas balearica]